MPSISCEWRFENTALSGMMSRLTGIKITEKDLHPTIKPAMNNAWKRMFELEKSCLSLDPDQSITKNDVF